MEQMSNKTLVFLLIAVIVVSVGGTIISLNRLNQLIPKGITGMGITGVVNVSIAAVSSINIIDTTIDFGSCSPNATYGSNISSNNSDDWGARGVCKVGDAVVSRTDNITVQNDGNKDVNVTVKTGINAADFIGGTTPGFYFNTRNGSDRAGCFNHTGGPVPSGFDGNKGMQYNWKNFGGTISTEFLACANLTYQDENDQLSLFVLLDLPPDTPVQTEQEATLTFTARVIT